MLTKGKYLYLTVSGIGSSNPNDLAEEKEDESKFSIRIGGCGLSRQLLVDLHTLNEQVVGR